MNNGMKSLKDKADEGTEPAKVKVKVKVKGTPDQVQSAMETMHIREMRAVVKKEKS